MKSYFLLITECLLVLSSCNKATQYSRIEFSIKTIPETHCVIDKHPINEIFNPADIYSVGDYILIVNSNRQCQVLYRYNSDDMTFDRSFGSYGRAGNEYLFIGQSPKQNNDSTLFLYTDIICCTELRIKHDTIQEISRIRITDDVSNNLLILNDTLAFYRALQSDKAFKIYNYKQRKHERSFGDFPSGSLKYKSDIDKDNICVSTSVYNQERHRLLSFYESFPLIRIFDMDKYNIIQETELTDIKGQISSLDKYYDDENTVYFLRPVATHDRVFVQLINAQANHIPEQTILLSVDWKGNITDKYILDTYCHIFTVSQTGTFFGIAFCDDSMVLCKAQLETPFSSNKDSE